MTNDLPVTYRKRLRFGQCIWSRAGRAGTSGCQPSRFLISDQTPQRNDKCIPMTTAPVWPFTGVKIGIILLGKICDMYAVANLFLLKVRPSTVGISQSKHYSTWSGHKRRHGKPVVAQLLQAKCVRTRAKAVESADVALAMDRQIILWSNSEKEHISLVTNTEFLFKAGISACLWTVL
jgi:hypothetical protein